MRESNILSNYEKLTLLTTSYSGTEDILEIHEKIFPLYWKDCPFRRVMVCDDISANGKEKFPGYDEIIVCGKETAKLNLVRLTEALRKIESKYVLFDQEDMLLYAQISTNKICSLISALDKYNASLIKLLPTEFGKTGEFTKDFSEDSYLLEYSKQTPYLVSYTPAIWNREFLISITEQYDNAADFERRGTIWAGKQNCLFLGTKYIVYPHFNAMWRGRWTKPAVDLLNYYEIVPDFNKHPLISSKELLKQSLMNYIFNLAPYQILKLQNLFNIGKHY